MNALRRVDTPRSDDGFTLVEMIVAMAITAVILTMVGTFFVNVSKVTLNARSSHDGMAQATLAMNEVRNIVSMASDNQTSQTATTPAISAGSGTGLTVISYANSTSTAIAPSSVVFALDASGYLSETRTAGIVASTGLWGFTGAVTTRRIAGPFLLSSGTPFFSYIDQTGAVLPATAGALATADLTKVAFVRLTAKVASRTAAGASDPVVVTTVVGLTNLYRDIDPTVTLPGLAGGQ